MERKETRNGRSQTPNHTKRNVQNEHQTKRAKLLTNRTNQHNRVRATTIATDLDAIKMQRLRQVQFKCNIATAATNYDAFGFQLFLLKDDNYTLFRYEDWPAWVTFTTAFFVLITLDNVVLYRNPHVLTVTRAIVYSLFWILVACCFAGYVYWYCGQHQACCGYSSTCRS